jgi:hypothetical protein
MHATGHDVQLRFRPLERLDVDLDLSWNRIRDSGRFRTESAHSLDFAWRLFDDASFSVGLFARAKNERDAGRRNRKHGFEARLELPIRPIRRWRPLRSLDGRFVVKQDFALSQDDRSRAGGTTVRQASWAVFCSLELSVD